MSRRVADQSASQARPRQAAGEDAERPSEGQEGYWAYMQRQINERTEKLGMVGESMDHLQERSASWAKDVNKYVNQQKRNVLFGGKVPCPLFKFLDAVFPPLFYFLSRMKAQTNLSSLRLLIKTGVKSKFGL